MRAWLRNCWPAWGTGIALAILTVFVGAPALAPHVVSMDRYYTLRSVTIADAPAGVSPKIIVDRTIRRDFRGRFEIEIMRAEGSEFVAWWECGPHVSDWRMYRDEATLPAHMTLDWWMGIPPNRECPLPPGTYKIISTIYARGPFGSELSATTESNVFNIRPALGRP